MTTGAVSPEPHEPPAGDRFLPAVMVLAVTAAVIRLIPLQWLHPLNWDEIEFFTATNWIGQGLVPFRDFWEHHTPLAWILFAPFTWLTDTPGVGAIIALRWVQVPVWIAVFWMTLVWMRAAGIGRFARWAAAALALASSLFMLPAIEYRVEALGCLLVMSALVLVQRERWFAAGVMLCLAGFANVRLGPVLVVAVVVLLVQERKRALPLVTGGLAALLVSVGLAAATGALGPMIRQVWIENLNEKFAMTVIGGFWHRLLVPFGIRVIASDRLFELAAVDLGGIAILLLGAAGLYAAFRVRGPFLIIAILQLANLAFIARMKFIYNYHFALVVIFMIPLVALVIERIPRRAVVLSIVLAAWCVNAFASLFRGKEMDLAYQDRIMREVHARTAPSDVVWSGIPWALRREPAYHFWFLPELARILVRTRQAEPYLVPRAPGALVVDHNALVWLGTVQRELAPLFVRHYVPVWRELWVPGLNARLAPGMTARWVAPKDGDYVIHASRELAGHPWFRDPLLVAWYKREEAARFTTRLPAPGTSDVAFEVDGNPVDGRVAVLHLRTGQRVTATSRAAEPLGVVLLASRDRVLFREPPAGVSLEGETTRVTHVPHPGARIEP